MDKKEKEVISPGVITKAAQVATLEATDKEMALINKLTLVALKAEEVFVFKVAMCDNEIDRTFEVFPSKSLKKMQKLFIGKTMIKDHMRSANNQVARIYATELVASDNETTQKGEPYTQLVAHCYMLNNETNKDLIDEIKGGIKKEVSVGLRISKALCSICGTDNTKSYCSHYNGREYEGKLCHFSLEDPVDAYELSFVAVPAQARAGITKQYGVVEKEEELLETQEAQPEEKQEIEMGHEEDLNLRIKALDAFLFCQNLKGDN